MELVVSHMSALDFWRLVYRLDKRLGLPQRMPRLAGALAVNEQDVWSIAPKWVTPKFLEPEGGVLHVLASSENDRRISRTHVAHQWEGRIPDGGLYGFGDGTYVCSPGFAFLQLASALKEVELIALACELSGCYLFDRYQERGFRTRREPLVTLEGIEQFLLGAKGAYGQQKAMRALRHAVPNAASPREALVALLLTLPRRMGGYGLPVPHMNHAIDLSPAARRLCGKGFLRVDLCYPDCRLAIEYLGARDHEGVRAMRSDRSRTNALVEMGYSVIEITSNQLHDIMAFDVIAMQIAGRLGYYIRKEHRGALDRRIDLRRALFHWHDFSGHLPGDDVLALR